MVKQRFSNILIFWHIYIYCFILWVTGSFFSGIYALFHWGRILSFTTHSGGRKFLLFIELIYLGLSWIFSWFALVCSVHNEYF